MAPEPIRPVIISPVFLKSLVQCPQIKVANLQHFREVHIIEHEVHHGCAGSLVGCFDGVQVALLLIIHCKGIKIRACCENCTGCNII